MFKATAMAKAKTKAKDVGKGQEVPRTSKTGGKTSPFRHDSRKEMLLP